MIKSALHSENIEQYLKERYFVERELMGQRTSNSKGEKSTSNTRILEELFIEKVLQDPYFSIYVCKMIEESDFNHNDVLAYVNYIILEKYLDTSTLFDTSIVEKTSFYSTQMESGIDGLIDKFSGMTEIADLKYNDYYDSLRIKGDKTVLKAIEATPAKNEKINVRWQDESPFCWNGEYGLHFERLSKNNTKHHRNNESDRRIHEMEKKDVLKHLSFNDLRDQTRFLCKNIKSYLIYYSSDKRYLKTSLFAFLNFKPDFLCEIKTALEKHGMIEYKNDTNIAQFLKFYMDATFISQVSWFNSLEEKQKIEILNRYYDDVNLHISDTNLNLFGKHGLLHDLTYTEARKLYHEKDYDNAIFISDKVFENTNDEFLKYLCVSLIADTYQVKNDYNSALKYFEMAYDISKRFACGMKLTESLNTLRRKFPHTPDGDYRQYRSNMDDFHLIQYVELLNIAEMHCYLKSKDRADECFRKLNDDIRCFSIPKRIYILYQLATFCDRYQDLLEYRLYQKVVKLAESYEDDMLDSIEDDMEKEIFYLLEYDDSLTKEICVRKWIDNMRDISIEFKNKIAEIPSKDDSGTDLIKIYSDYNQCLSWNPKHYEKINPILESSGLTSIVLDTYSIVPITIEPWRILTRIENVIRDLEKNKANTGVTFQGLEYQDIIQRLDLACSRCYYALDNFDTAENILKEIIANSRDEEVLFNAHCILGMSLIKNWDVRSGINELEKAVDMNELNGLLFEICMYELLQLENKEIFYKVQDSIVNKINLNPINRENYRKNGYCLASWQFNEFGLTDEAMHFIEKGLSAEENELVKISLLEEKAYISFLDGNFEISESILNNILHISLSNQNNSAEYYLLCSSAWHKLSIICAKKHEFDKAAKYIDGAISSLNKCENHDEVVKDRIGSYSRLKEMYNILSEHVLLLDKIDIKEVTDIFITANEIISNGLEQNYNNEFDFKLAFVEYGKGLETYMHDKFSVNLRKKVFSENREPIDNKFWNGRKSRKGRRKIVGITPDLKNVLGINKDRTISSGYWKNLIKDAFDADINSINNPYIKDSYEFIIGFMPKEQWDIIAESCAVVSDFRNGAAHYGKGTLDDVLKVRGKIIQNINEVLAVMEKISSSTI